MIAVIFEVIPRSACLQEYLEIAARLKPALELINGFVSVRGGNG